MKNIIVFYKPEKKITAAAKKIHDFLKHKGCKVKMISDKEKAKAKEYGDVLIAVGGDGTMLRAARIASQTDVPVFGVNMGRFGFLSEVRPDDAIKVLPKVLAGEYKLDERMMIQAEVIRGSKKVGHTFALNDIVISKSGIARLIRFSVYVNKMLVRTHNADGIIVSTPTGSTAYNISVGGPIVYPTHPMFIISAICPHSMSDRPIVLSARRDKELVKVAIDIEKSPGEFGEVLLTADGQNVIKLKENDKIVFTEAPFRTKFIRLKEYDFFKVLRSKLKWD